MGLTEHSRIKTIAYISSIIALLSSIWVYMNTVLMGFPDGYLTEFQRALKPMLIGYSILALLFSILFYGIARLPNKKNSGSVLYFGLALFALIIIGAFILYFYFEANLLGGGGG